MQPRNEQEPGPSLAPPTARPWRAQPIQGTGDVAGNPSGGLLDYQAAARYLCTTTRHVRELWTRRELAAIKVGRSVRFTKTDLDAFIAANRVRAVR